MNSGNASAADKAAKQRQYKLELDEQMRIKEEMRLRERQGGGLGGQGDFFGSLGKAQAKPPGRRGSSQQAVQPSPVQPPLPVQQQPPLPAQPQMVLQSQSPVEPTPPPPPQMYTPVHPQAPPPIVPVANEANYSPEQLQAFYAQQQLFFQQLQMAAAVQQGVGAVSAPPAYAPVSYPPTATPYGNGAYHSNSLPAQIVTPLPVVQPQPPLMPQPVMDRESVIAPRPDSAGVRPSSAVSSDNIGRTDADLKAEVRRKQEQYRAELQRQIEEKNTRQPSSEEPPREVVAPSPPLTAPPQPQTGKAWINGRPVVAGEEEMERVRKEQEAKAKWRKDLEEQKIAKEQRLQREREEERLHEEMLERKVAEAMAKDDAGGEKQPAQPPTADHPIPQPSLATEEPAATTTHQPHPSTMPPDSPMRIPDQTMRAPEPLLPHREPEPEPEPTPAPVPVPVPMPIPEPEPEPTYTPAPEPVPVPTYTPVPEPVYAPVQPDYTHVPEPGFMSVPEPVYAPVPEAEGACPDCGCMEGDAARFCKWTGREHQFPYGVLGDVVSLPMLPEEEDVPREASLPMLPEEVDGEVPREVSLPMLPEEMSVLPEEISVLDRLMGGGGGSMFDKSMAGETTFVHPEKDDVITEDDGGITTPPLGPEGEHEIWEATPCSLQQSDMSSVAASPPRPVVVKKKRRKKTKKTTITDEAERTIIVEIDEGTRVTVPSLPESVLKDTQDSWGILTAFESRPDTVTSVGRYAATPRFAENGSGDECPKVEAALQRRSVESLENRAATANIRAIKRVLAERQPLSVSCAAWGGLSLGVTTPSRRTLAPLNHTPTTRAASPPLRILADKADRFGRPYSAPLRGTLPELPTTHAPAVSIGSSSKPKTLKDALSVDSMLLRSQSLQEAGMKSSRDLDALLAANLSRLSAMELED